jgi:3-methyl-2-oxobutanoate hydroxymethyltransferase
MVATIQFLTTRGIPVMAHVGLTPQSVNAFGGYAARGMKDDEYQRIIDDAVAVDQAGAFATVIEGVAVELGAEITEKVGNITIGIGASSACDGQVLVTDDMLGMFPRTAKFVKRYADIRTVIEDAAKAFARDVRERSFPGPEHTYKRKK